MRKVAFIAGIALIVAAFIALAFGAIEVWAILFAAGALILLWLGFFDGGPGLDMLYPS